MIENKDLVERLRRALDEADAVLVGAGAGLSTSAGLTYSGERFERLFPDLIDRYGLRDMYSAGFYPYETPEERWAFWPIPGIRVSRSGAVVKCGKMRGCAACNPYNRQQVREEELPRDHWAALQYFGNSAMDRRLQ